MQILKLPNRWSGERAPIGKKCLQAKNRWTDARPCFQCQEGGGGREPARAGASDSARLTSFGEMPQMSGDAYEWQGTREGRARLDCGLGRGSFSKPILQSPAPAPLFPTQTHSLIVWLCSSHASTVILQALVCEVEGLELSAASPLGCRNDSTTSGA